MASLLTLFVLVFVLNVMPAFAPPTWMLLSWMGLRFPEAGPAGVALVAALAATGGRSVLALFAQRIAASRWVGDAMRANLGTVAAAIHRHRSGSMASFLLFAFSPLPSNALFLAYGLARAPLAWLALPFFAGRFVSYALAFAGGAFVAEHFELAPSGWASLLYFVLSQGAALGLVLLFARIDWRRSGLDRRLRWVSRPSKR